MVTGAGVRLGRVMAEGFAARGCDLVLHAHRSRRDVTSLAAKLRKQGVLVEVLLADLTKSELTQKLARDAWRVFGHIDILVNNAAVYWPTPLEKLSVRELDSFLDLNLKAPYILSSELGRRMKKRGRGAIVNIACLSGLRAWKGFVPYSISKAGVVALTQGLAKLLAPEVRVNAVAPGTVLPPERMGTEEREEIRRGIPLRRLGSPSDLWRAVAYLVDSDFSTGVVLPVDGGRQLV
jgi:NAD(P)-dependent dehydrogenase (short-subunit alcohol dehydrogenase family)